MTRLSTSRSTPQRRPVQRSTRIRRTIVLIGLGVIVALIGAATASAATMTPHQKHVAHLEVLEGRGKLTPAQKTELAKIRAAKKKTPSPTAKRTVVKPAVAKVNPPRATPPRVAKGADKFGNTDATWRKVAQCESGVTNAKTGNGYYGYFQFSAATWKGIGGKGLPSDHDYATQLAMAKKLRAQTNPRQWPVCSRKANLR